MTRGFEEGEFDKIIRTACEHQALLRWTMARYFRRVVPPPYSLPAIEDLANNERPLTKLGTK